MSSPFKLIDERIAATNERRLREIETLKSFERDKMLTGAQNLFRRQGQDLTMMHVPTGYLVKFPAFLDNINDAYTSKWTEESVFGRMDPISVFSHTERVISVAWNVPADSFEQAEANLGRVNQLISFLYPLYDKSNGETGATDINQSPLIRLSFGNIIKAPGATGLLGFVNGITFDPILDYGMFNRKKIGGARLNGDPQDNEYFPKTFRLNLEFNVMHENELGFKTFVKQKKRFQESSTNQRGERFTFHDSNLDFNNFPYKTEGAKTGFGSENYISYPTANSSGDGYLPTPSEIIQDKIAQQAQYRSDNAGSSRYSQSGVPGEGRMKEMEPSGFGLVYNSKDGFFSKTRF